jgi:hypothetical protein
MILARLRSGDIYTYKNGHAAAEQIRALSPKATKKHSKRSEIMKVVLTNLPGESHWHNGQAHCAGAVIDLPKEVAERMIGGGLAVKLGAEAKTSASAKTSVPLDAEVTLPPMPEVSE